MARVLGRGPVLVVIAHRDREQIADRDVFLRRVDGFDAEAADRFVPLRLEAQTPVLRFGRGMGQIRAVGNDSCSPCHDELVLSVNARTLTALAEAIARGLRGIDDPAAAISAMADACLDYASANTPRWDALFAHRMSGGVACRPGMRTSATGCSTAGPP